MPDHAMKTLRTALSAELLITAFTDSVSNKHTATQQADLRLALDPVRSFK